MACITSTLGGDRHVGNVLEAEEKEDLHWGAQVRS